jgi:hypothetical protein
MLKSFCLLLLTGIIFSSCKDYGKKTTKGHVSTYYKDGITESQAKGATNLMFYIDSVTGNPKTEKSFQLIREKDTVCFRMVVAKDKMSDVSDNDFLAISNMVSDSVFNGHPVNMDLTDNLLNTIKRIPFKKINFSGE